MNYENVSGLAAKYRAMFTLDDKGRWQWNVTMDEAMAAKGVYSLIVAASGEFTADDTRYEYIVDSLDRLADLEHFGTDYDAIVECADCIEPDVYTSQLTAWLASSINRLAYLDQVKEDYETWPETAFYLLSEAQVTERRETFYAVAEWLRSVDGE